MRRGINCQTDSTDGGKVCTEFRSDWMLRETRETGYIYLVPRSLDLAEQVCRPSDGIADTYASRVGVALGESRYRRDRQTPDR